MCKNIENDKKIVVTEEMHPEKEWFAEAKEKKVDDLRCFIKHLVNDYTHDYGTVCRAVAASAVAAAWAANREGGFLTGFQAGFVMWDFIRYWMKPSNQCGMKLIDYDDFLFPQNAYKFEKTIDSDTWSAIQNEARKNLKEMHDSMVPVHPRVLEHWKSIVDGNVPFGYRVSDSARF